MGTHPIFESDFDCPTEMDVFRILLIVPALITAQQQQCRHADAAAEMGVAPHGHALNVPCPLVSGSNKGLISSPIVSGTAVYPSLCHCEYVIGAELTGEYATIELTFVKMHIENKCASDYVQVKSKTSTLTDRLCGDRLPETMKRKVEFLVIVTFASDADFKSYEGFALEYEIIYDNQGAGECDELSIRNTRQLWIMLPSPLINPNRPMLACWSVSWSSSSSFSSLLSSSTTKRMPCSRRN